MGRKTRTLLAAALVGLSGLILGGVVPAGKRHELIVPDYSTAPADQIDKMTEKMLSDFNDNIVGDLMAQLERGPNLSNEAKVLIIYALGQLRTYRATWILIENINFVAQTKELALRRPRWFAHPARGALVKIGRYASDGIMRIIGSHKFDKEKVEGYAEVVVSVEGPKYALMRLEDRLEKAENDAARKQYEMVISRVEWIIASSDL